MGPTYPSEREHEAKRPSALSVGAEAELVSATSFVGLKPGIGIANLAIRPETLLFAKAVGENVGEGPTVTDIHNAFMNSPEHKANILDHDFTQVGVGVSVDKNGIIWVTECRLGVRLPEVTPADHLADLAPRPVMLITGALDRYPSPNDLQRLYERCQGPRERCVIPAAGHLDVCEQGGDSYRETVLNFFEKSLV